MRERRKSYEARELKERRLAVRKFRRAVGMKIAEGSKDVTLQ